MLNLGGQIHSEQLEQINLYSKNAGNISMVRGIVTCYQHPCTLWIIYVHVKPNSLKHLYSTIILETRRRETWTGINGYSWNEGSMSLSWLLLPRRPCCCAERFMWHINLTYRPILWWDNINVQNYILHGGIFGLLPYVIALLFCMEPNGACESAQTEPFCPWIR